MSKLQILRCDRGILFNIVLPVLDLKVLYKRWEKHSFHCTASKRGRSNICTKLIPDSWYILRIYRS